MAKKYTKYSNILPILGNVTSQQVILIWPPVYFDPPFIFAGISLTPCLLRPPFYSGLKGNTHNQKG